MDDEQQTFDEAISGVSNPPPEPQTQQGFDEAMTGVNQDNEQDDKK